MFSREVYEKVGGFILTRLGEDIEYSIRIHENGFKIGLIPDAKVYHKRRTSFKQFYKQLHFFGRARINIYKHFPAELKAVHFFPAIFTLGLGFTLVCNVFYRPLAYVCNFFVLLYFLLIFFSRLAEQQINKNCIFECSSFFYTAHRLWLRFYTRFCEKSCDEE